MAVLRWWDTASNRAGSYSRWWLGVVLSGLLAVAACSSPTPQLERLQKEVKALKAEVAKQNERLDQLQAGQQQLLALLEGRRPSGERVPGAGAELEGKVPGSEKQELTVSQLLKQKDRYLGNRVTVKGELGLILIHHKTFFLTGPGEQITVFFGNLPDKATVRDLTTKDRSGQIAVTGVFSPSRQMGGGYQIIAENIDFL